MAMRQKTVAEAQREYLTMLLQHEDLAAVVAPEVAERFEELVKRAWPRGRWQVKLLLELARRGRVPASAARLLKGRAAAYVGRYQRSLEALMARAGARFMPGPRGGRWTGYYCLPADGE